MAQLFDRDVKTISKHIKNAFDEWKPSKAFFTFFTFCLYLPNHFVSLMVNKRCQMIDNVV